MGKARFFCCLLFTFWVGCSSTGTGDDNLIWRLNNRGPLVLSSENPFLAANLFVSKLAEKHQVIYGFLQHRGVPPAVAVESGYFSEPVVHFYYPEDREFFILEHFDSGWVVNGPERISSERQQQVALATRSLRGEPVLRVQEHPELLVGGSEAQSAFARAGESTFENQVSSSDTGFNSTRTTANSDVRSLERKRVEDRLEQVVKRLQGAASPSGAELTPKGDLIHYVIYPGETLSIIARWYTHDRANVGRLARINGLTNPDHLEVGDSILVPSYLLKNKSGFSEQDLKELIAVSSSL